MNILPLLTLHGYHFEQWQHQGVMRGICPPPVGGSAPTSPRQKGKMAKNQLLFMKVWILPQKCILPPQCPHKNVLVLPLILRNVIFSKFYNIFFLFLSYEHTTELVNCIQLYTQVHACTNGRSINYQACSQEIVPAQVNPDNEYLMKLHIIQKNIWPTLFKFPF